MIAETDATRFVDVKCDGSAKSGIDQAPEVPESAATTDTLFADGTKYLDVTSNKPADTASVCSVTYA